MKELVYSVKVVTRDALLGSILDAADRIRKSAEAAKSYSRSSQPSGSCVAAGGGIFENQL